MLDNAPVVEFPSSLPANRTHRVLSIPSRHPYISAITPPTVSLVAANRTSSWEPDPIFESGALALVGEVDIVHLHFSYDHVSVLQIRRWLREINARNVKLVLTVHDLRNPHHELANHHDGLLAELIPAADAVITLTPGAAAEILDRFGVHALVAPHPTMTDPSRSQGVETEAGLVTMNLKYMRRNVVDPLPMIEAAVAGANDAGGRVRVDVQSSALSHPQLQGLERLSGVELSVHDPYDDVEFERYVRRAHVAVLPYRWGTHSGWLEMAKDLGTYVVAPDCGYFADQWSEVVPFVSNERDGVDLQSLRKAVAWAVSQSPLEIADRQERVNEAAAVRRMHDAIYRRVTS